ncbi:MAG: hypothetical protein RSE00_00160 [Clostridia bacterium]
MVGSEFDSKIDDINKSLEELKKNSDIIDQLDKAMNFIKEIEKKKGGSI